MSTPQTEPITTPQSPEDRISALESRVAELEAAIDPERLTLELQLYRLHRNQARHMPTVELPEDFFSPEHPATEPS